MAGLLQGRQQIAIAERGIGARGQRPAGAGTAHVEPQHGNTGGHQVSRQTADAWSVHATAKPRDQHHQGPGRFLLRRGEACQQGISTAQVDGECRGEILRQPLGMDRVPQRLQIGSPPRQPLMERGRLELGLVGLAQWICPPC